MGNAQKRRYWVKREENIMKYANKYAKRENFHLKKRVEYNNKKRRKIILLLRQMFIKMVIKFQCMKL